ncbi:glutathione S-transferase N-terminal domain-containing protein [Nocardioides sp. WS12]|uniref:glutathione S-transferase family protein n=1 Tax=Nocardioides sp. WS12 TaxID=2486272 RepID=UPI0015FDABC5|nr:glutathione S-transferase N-terminal domain-containing protein [Nocardioides sp. WS12]
MIDLYYYTSPNVRKVLIALEELELEYQIRWTDISGGEQFSPEYLQINPNGKVPAIVDHDGPDGRPLALFESGAILLYLAEKTGKLLPADPIERWDAVAWTVWQVANHGPIAGQSTHFHKYAPAMGINDEYATGRYLNEIRRLYGVLDTRLADRDYIAGEFSIADVATYPWTRVAKGQGVDIEGEFPHVAAWTQRVGERPSTKVRVSDPREAKASKNEYTAEQFQTLFRPPDTTGNPTIDSPEPAVAGGNQ